VCAVLEGRVRTLIIQRTLGSTGYLAIRGRTPNLYKALVCAIWRGGSTLLLKAGEQIRIRLAGSEDEWCPAGVALASGIVMNEQSVALMLDGMVRTAGDLGFIGCALTRSRAANTTRVAGRRDVVDDCTMSGLLTGGPQVHVARCEDILRRGGDARYPTIAARH
jgi:hypothetical protein